MTSSIYLHSIDYHILPSRGGKIPRDRYREYMHDLYKIYQGEVSPETFLEGGQYSYVEVGEPLLERLLQENKLQCLDTLIIAHWSQEFDPDYASCGAHFLYKYDLQCDMFDICDKGTLAPFMALKILIDYQRLGKSKNGMVLCLEQTTIPRDKNDGDVIPTENGALGCIIGSSIKLKTPYFKINAIEIIPEAVFINECHKTEFIKQKIFAHCNASMQDVKIITRKNTAIWKILKYRMFQDDNLLKKENLCFMEPHIGCLSAFKSLSQHLTASKILLIDEDVETLNTAILFLERCE